MNDGLRLLAIFVFIALFCVVGYQLILHWEAEQEGAQNQAHAVDMTRATDNAKLLKQAAESEKLNQ